MLSKWRVGKLLFAVLFWIICTTLSLSNGYTLPTVINLELPLPKLPLCLDGYKIVMASDAHAGALVGKSDLEPLVSLLNQQQGDAITLVGDFGDGAVSRLSQALASISRLQAPDGVFFVTGNHEFQSGEADAWLRYHPSRCMQIRVAPPRIPECKLLSNMQHAKDPRPPHHHSSP